MDSVHRWGLLTHGILDSGAALSFSGAHGQIKDLPLSGDQQNLCFKLDLPEPGSSRNTKDYQIYNLLKLDCNPVDHNN